MIHIFSRWNATQWCVCDDSGTGSLWPYNLRHASLVRNHSNRYMVDVGRANPGCTYYGLFEDYNDFISQYPELLI
jgi:hypothetical protein